MQFLQLVLIEPFTKVGILLFTGVLYWIGFKGILQRENWRPMFKESEEIVWMLNFQLKLLFTCILFPHIFLLAPLLYYILFFGYYVYLVYLAQKPLAHSNKETTGVVIYSFMSLSMMVFMGFLIIVYLVPIRHQFWNSKPERLCGPF